MATILFAVLLALLAVGYRAYIDKKKKNPTLAGILVCLILAAVGTFVILGLFYV